MMTEKESNAPTEEVKPEDKTLQPSDEVGLVDWDGPNDPQNPLNWPNSRKWAAIGLVSFNTFNTYDFARCQVHANVQQCDGLNFVCAKCAAGAAGIPHDIFRIGFPRGLCVYHGIRCWSSIFCSDE